MLKFDSPKKQPSIIKVLGIGGGGSNAVNHMYNQGIEGVDFIVCNTDAQALASSPVPIKVQVGSSLTEGRGAGSIPERGREATLENIDDIRSELANNTKMLFITAGMGGGTGTGGAPVIAAMAKELGLLTVGIVTIPFSFEGRKRKLQAENGIKELRQYVDSILIICNDKLREQYGDLPLSRAFAKADDILTTAAKGIAEIITVPGYINVDFEDVKTVMQDSGIAIMGTGVAEGENRALRAVEMALTSPLLNDNNIEGANNILLYISSGSEEISMDEVTEITDYIQSQAGMNSEIIWGNGRDASLESSISVTLIATGFDLGTKHKKEEKKTIVMNLHDPVEPPVFAAPVADTAEIRLVEKTPEATEAQTVEETAVMDSPRTFLFEIETPLKPVQEPEKEYAFSDTFLESPREEHVNEPFTPLQRDPLPDNDQHFSTPGQNGVDKRSKERISRLRELSIKLKTPGGITELENQPAYLRRNVELPEVKPSSESEISRFTLSDGPDNKAELRNNNSYLHDAVD